MYDDFEEQFRIDIAERTKEVIRNFEYVLDRLPAELRPPKHVAQTLYMAVDAVSMLIRRFKRLTEPTGELIIHTDGGIYINNKEVIPVETIIEEIHRMSGCSKADSEIIALWLPTILHLAPRILRGILALPETPGRFKLIIDR